MSNPITRKDDTNAFGRNWLQIIADIPEDFDHEISRLDVKISNLPVMSYDSPTFPLNINLTSEQTKNLKDKEYIVLIAYDEDGLRETCKGRLEFTTRSEAQGGAGTSNGAMSAKFSISEQDPMKVKFSISALIMDYNLLVNKPQINSVELVGNKSLADLGITTEIDTRISTHNSSNAAHPYIQGLITAEATTRAAADTQLQANIDTEATTRAQADTTLQTNINNEATTRAAADTQLQANIDTEATTRANADSALDTRVTANTNAIQAEATTRAQADTALGTRITNETSAREQADETLQANITAEATTRAQADTTLQNDINTRATKQALLTEINDRQEADADIQEEINTLTETVNTKVTKNADITGATHTKITYDKKGLVTGGTDLTESDIPSLHLTKITDVTATATELNYVDGVTSNIQTQLDNKLPNTTKYGADLSYSDSKLQLKDQDGNLLGNSVTIKSSPAIDNSTITKNTNDELQAVNLVGLTSTITELNYSDGVTSNIQTQLNSKVEDLSDLGITATATELNYTDGVTSNIQTQLDAKVEDLSDLGITATASEINVLDGITATTTELNYVDGVTSSIQTQLNGKLTPSDVINNVTSTTTDKPLSANMGKELQDEIDVLKARGRFLALWNCATGLAQSDPSTSPYTYKTGDYYIIGTVATGENKNYKPTGTEYVIGTASTVEETQSVSVDDVYYYDGSSWHLQINTQKTVSFANIAGQPTDNSNLASALNSKQPTIDSSNKLSSDLVDDTNHTNKFVTETEKLTWSGKQDAGNYLTTDTEQTISSRAVKTFNGRVNFIGSGDNNAIYISTDTRFDIYGGTSTVLGFANGTFLINHPSYALNLRGSGTRPTFNGNANYLALYSDTTSKVTANTSITGATHSKITYDSKGLVTAGSDLALTDLGVTASSTELNYTDGVTSNIQTQLNGKLTPSDVIDNVTSTTTNKPLSANMGKELQDQITNLKALGRYLSTWNCSTGLAGTDPVTSPYTYKTGDYYLVGVVASEGGTNYKPDGSQYVIGTASTTEETETVMVNDTYIYDGSTWKLQINSQRTVTFASIVGEPTDNTNLANTLDSMASIIRRWE